MTFKNLGLPEFLISALAKQKIVEPTSIQLKCVEPAIRKQDILGIAKTGSGKTLGFVLPILANFKMKMGAKNRQVNTLVLAPTRELAEQIKQVFDLLCSSMPQPPKVMAVYGGVSINPQMKGLFGVNIIIATPGRLIELHNSNAVKLSGVNTLVIDEADKMLNLGFKDEMDKILSLLPSSRQTMLFSATLSKDIKGLQSVILNNALVLKADDKTTESEPILIHQKVYLVSDERKGPLLRYLIRNEPIEQALVFASSTLKVEKITTKLEKNGVTAKAIHGKKSQGARNAALHNFIQKELPILVTTDLLSRGIDIAFLPHVINYELPRSPKDFIHRIGRTGRAENPGQAITLITPDELHHFNVILKKMKLKVEIIETDDINLRGY